MQTELTPTIAEMSEVVAKYMGWEMDLLERYPELCLDWRSIHSVWEKVRNQLESLVDGEDSDAVKHYRNLEEKIIRGTTEQCLTALYNAIIFINQLKEQNNANKDI